MKMSIIKIKNLKYADENNENIYCDAYLKGFGWSPYILSKHDVVDYAVEAFYKAVNGEWGEISPYEKTEELENFVDPYEEHAWVEDELNSVQVQLMYHWTDDERATETLEAWKQYARDLRNYTTTDEHGNPQIREGETRPQRPTE